jgi:hypothetical protein
MFELKAEPRGPSVFLMLDRFLVGLIIGLATPAVLWFVGVGSAGYGHGSYFPLLLLCGYPAPWGALIWPLLGFAVSRPPSRGWAGAGLGALVFNVAGIVYGLRSGAAGIRLDDDLARANLFTIVGIGWYLVVIFVALLYFLARMRVSSDKN